LLSKEARERYREFVAAGVGLKLAPPWARAAGGWLLGSPKFVAKTYAILAKDRKDSRWDSRASQGKRTIEAALDQIALAVCKELSVTPEQLKSRDAKARDARRAFALIARESAGHSLKSIGEHVQMTAVSNVKALVDRATERFKRDDEFARRVARLESRLAKNDN
jgi:hypothetical protein